MGSFISDGKEMARVLFWGALAFVVGQALRRRQALQRVVKYAPFTAGAATAYLVGCFVGAALVTYFP
jgi:hypothetical protein